MKVISCRVVNEPNCSVTTGVGLEKILFISVNLENELNSHPNLDSAIKWDKFKYINLFVDKTLEYGAQFEYYITIYVYNLNQN